MSSTFSDVQVYVLAERARAKFAGQLGAKDHNLRRIVAHARLYDILDDHVEEMKTRRLRKSSVIPQHAKDDSSANYQGIPVKYEKGRRTGPGQTGKTKDSAWTTSDIVAECAIIEDGHTYPFLTDIDIDTSISVIEVEDINDNPLSGKAHGSPAIIITQEKLNGEEAPSHTIGTSKKIISEIPMNSDSDSDSESGSDSDSDYDYDSDFHPRFDLPFSQPEQSATPLPFPRHNTPYHHMQWNNDMTVALQSSDIPIDLIADEENLKTLERSTNISQEAENQLSYTTPAIGLTPTRGVSLSPRLYDESLDNLSSAVYRLNEFLESLRQILNPYSTKAKVETARRNALSRYFSILAFWSRRKRPAELGQDVCDEVMS